MTFANLGSGGLGASVGYGKEGDIGGAVKGAALGLAGKKAAELIFSPANISKLAVFLSKTLDKNEASMVANEIAKSMNTKTPLAPEISAKIQSVIQNNTVNK